MGAVPYARWRCICVRLTQLHHACSAEARIIANSSLVCSPRALVGLAAIYLADVPTCLPGQLPAPQQSPGTVTTGMR
jgi:hypothetical protein